jgi:hypothetical protein
MLQPTQHFVPFELVRLAQFNTEMVDFKLSINQPTGDFFYDPWVMKPEFEGTIWHQLLNTLPETLGEARLIRLKPAEAYRSHADIDNRWHLNILGEKSYLVNLDTETMYPLNDRSRWYYLDASPRHSAVNFGREDRVQLVVRELLQRNSSKSLKVSIKPKGPEEKYRFYFDDGASQWVNKQIKNDKLADFKNEGLNITFTLEPECMNELCQLVQDYFVVESTVL